jgi:hypothetical protein
MDNNSRYKQLGKNPLGMGSVVVKTSIPTPTESDYKRGFIKRYFVTKSNSDTSTIYEVDSQNYIRIVKSPLYKGVSLRWKIKGNPKELKYSNGKSIEIASEKIKNLGLYLPNLLQFHK